MQNNNNNKIYDVVIVGGGLSGLVVAQGLHHDNDDDDTQIDWLLLEAQSALGGRLVNDDDTSNSSSIDMGGTWIWPHAQPKVRDLVNHVLQLKTFAQPDDPSSTRIEGGAVQLIDKLAEQLPAEERIQLNTPVVSCTLVKNGKEDDTDSHVVVQLVTENKETLYYYYARRVVFAVPPKLIEKHIQFDPPLSAAKRQAMAACHTWMAGVTKVALVYPERFWKNLNYHSNMGLARSAQEASPAFQVYDGSTRDGSIAALTFFCLVPPSSPANDDDKLLAQQVARQMADAWKQLQQPKAIIEKATQYSRFCVQRWPLQKYISENDKPTTIRPHPHPVAALAQPEWDEGGRSSHLLEFCASETDQRDPGVMEGAVGAAHRVLQSLRATKSR